jgi:hypothetical protein
VSFSKNRAAWVETIKLATQKRFDIKDLPLVFLAILYTNLERLLEDKNSKAAVALRPAFNWACGMILQEAEFVDLDVSPKTTPASYLLRIFHNLLDSTYAVELLMYPIDGFIVANVALSDSLHKMKIIAPKRARIVFYRFLYHLTEQYFKLGSESGELVRHATMVIMLIAAHIGSASPIVSEILGREGDDGSSANPLELAAEEIQAEEVIYFSQGTTGYPITGCTIIKIFSEAGSLVYLDRG